MNQDFSQAIIARIEEQHVEPRAAWIFRARRVVLVVGGVITMVAGGLAFASLLYIVHEQEWGIAWQSGRLWRALPFVWLGVFLAFLLATVRDVQEAPRGYKYEAWIVALVVFVGSASIGGLVYAAGYEHVPDAVIRDSVTSYEWLVPSPDQIWHSPEQGRYAGLVVTSTAQGLRLEGVDGQSYEVHISTSSAPVVARMMEPGMRVKLFATSTEWLGQGLAPVPSAVRVLEAHPRFKRPLLQRRDDLPRMRWERLKRQEERARSYRGSE